MRLVAQPEIRPQRCAVLPQVGHNHPKGYIDTGQELPWDSHVYVSVAAVEELGHVIGLATKAEVETARQATRAAQRRLELQSKELEELRAFKASVHVIKSAGFKSERRRGPAPGKRKAVA